MNLTPEQARARLVEALRSGKYVQARFSLRNGDRYCCLGVACDIYREHGLDDWALNSASWWCFLGEKYVLPERVKSWFGFKHQGVLLKNRIEERGAATLTSLMDMNDAGETFDEIADEIEKGNVILEETS